MFIETDYLSMSTSLQAVFKKRTAKNKNSRIQCFIKHAETPSHSFNFLKAMRLVIYYASDATSN